MKRLTMIVVAAIVLGGGAASADVGRLFFSPSERAALEAARRASTDPAAEVIEPEPETIIETIVEEPQEERPTITVDGYVRRSSGRATVWVNGENSYDGDLGLSGVESGSARERAGRISLTPIGADAPVSLRPGQTFDPNSAVSTDAYENPAAGAEMPGS
jgi:hypothetical protein